MSRGKRPTHVGYDEMITNAIIGEVDAELEFSGLTDYTFDKRKGELTFRKPHDMDELDAVLRVARVCLLDGLSVTIK